MQGYTSTDTHTYPHIKACAHRANSQPYISTHTRAQTYPYYPVQRSLRPYHGGVQADAREALERYSLEIRVDEQCLPEDVDA